MKIEELKFDANGLIPAIATDAESNKVLMLAYMNKQALELTLKDGIAHYYSRSRQKLWKKGETSGHIQKVVSIHTDCDNDCILMKVVQTGVACHTGEPSCFFNEIKTFQEMGNMETLSVLQKVIQDRIDNPLEGSYTNYLINKGKEKICKKVGEEASECIIAAMKGDNDELTAEIADLFYHTFVLMKACKMEFNDVLAVLQKRHKPAKD